MDPAPHDPAEFDWRALGTSVGERRGKKRDGPVEKTDRQRVGAKRKKVL